MISKAFGESPLRLNLAITAYLLSLGIFIPLSGWLADRFGARTVFSSATLGFFLRLPRNAGAEMSGRRLAHEAIGEATHAAH